MYKGSQSNLTLYRPLALIAETECSNTSYDKCIGEFSNQSDLFKVHIENSA